MEFTTLKIAGTDAIRLLDEHRARFPETGVYPFLIGDAEELAQVEEAAGFRKQDPATIINASLGIDLAAWRAETIFGVAVLDHGEAYALRRRGMPRHGDSFAECYLCRGSELIDSRSVRPRLACTTRCKSEKDFVALVSLKNSIMSGCPTADLSAATTASHDFTLVRLKRSTLILVIVICPP